MKKAKIRKEDLKALIEDLAATYRVIGPKAIDGAVVLSEISGDDVPSGSVDRQGPGSYRLEEGSSGDVFSFSPGPDSFKKFLHPSSSTVFSFGRSPKATVVEKPEREDRPMAFVGVRACDLAALDLLDKVFLEGPVREPGYESRRRDIFIAAVNCLHPGQNCFCASMGTGPEAKEGFDLAMTEIDGFFLLEAGTVKGGEALGRLARQEASEDDMAEKEAAVSLCREEMKKTLKTGDLPGILYRNAEHPRWAEIAERDLECGNCTMVCPTCFCNSSFDTIAVKSISANLKEFSGVRKRSWDSCFSKNFARVHGGNFRPSRKARYRHWMTHKLAYWIDQFGRPGCVGCGRCITWCPVGIDITHELEEVRRVR